MPNKLTDKELKIIMKATKAFNEIGIERYTKAGIFVGELLGIIDRLQAENERLKAEIKFSERSENKKRKKFRAENKYIKPAKSIRQVIKEMEEYNKANGTKLTYGQYICMEVKDE